MSAPAQPSPEPASRPAPLPEASLWPRSRWEWAALVAAIGVVFGLRFAILLRAGGYPPSEDAAADLYNARLWATGSFGGSSSALLHPPVYYFALVLPLAAVMPVLTATDVMMALVPGLLVVPAYLLLKQVGVDRPVGLLFASLLALCPAYSNMLTWNSAYNLFAIVLLVAFFVALLAYLAHGQRRDLFLTALLFSLVLGAHELTAVVLLETTILFFLLLAVLAAYQHGLRALVRRWAPLGFWTAVFSVPWLPVYVYSYVHVTNVGYAYGLVNWPVYIAGGVVQAWVGGSALLLYLGGAASIGGVVALAFRFRRYPELNLLFLALFVASISVAFLDSSNAERGLLFLPIVFVLALGPPISDGLRYLRRAPVPRPGGEATEAPPPKAVRLRARFRPSPAVRSAVTAVCVAGLVAFSVANVANSASVFATSNAFNSVLSAQAVAVMEWLNGHAAAGSTVFVPTPALGWAQYFEPQLNVIGPYQSGINVVTNGLSTIDAANEAYLGGFTLGNGYLGASVNYPGIGTPLIWIGDAGYNFMFATSPNGSASIEVTIGATPTTLLLDAASLTSVTNRTTPGTQNGSMTFAWHWTSPDVSANETIVLTGETVAFSWATSTPGVTLDWVTTDFELPPSTYYYTYTSVPAAGGTSGLDDAFMFQVGYAVNVPFALAVATGNGSVSQLRESDGWTALETVFAPTLSLQFSGLPLSPGETGAYAANATALLRALGVNYVVVNSAVDSELYSYVANLNVTGYARATVVDGENPWYAFRLSFV